MFLSVLLFIASYLLSSGQSGNKPQAPMVACNTPDVLKGLGKIVVVVRPLPAWAEDFHLYQGQLTADVKVLLRQSGVKIDEVASSTAVSTKLVIETEVGPTSETLVHTYRVTVRLIEPVVVWRNDKNNKNDRPLSVTGAVTWEKSQAGSVDEDKWADILQEKVQNFVDQFCNDYRKANPKS
jgi:hypothetical protein